MIAVDTNIIIDIIVKSSQFHKESFDYFKTLKDEFVTAPTNIGECLRLLTHPRVFAKPLSTMKAVKILSEFLEMYHIRIIDEPLDWWQTLPDIIKLIPDLHGDEIFDARIAISLRAAHVTHIMTRDSDFKKYSFLKSFYREKS
ncbi:MAG: PIN domain-containing protein [Deltaproteobacteria bacterium]|nr:PIN domain-containing protein [Deltaproteobacteria bacterium]